LFLGFLFLSVSFNPSIWYSVNKEATQEDTEQIVSLVTEVQEDPGEDTPPKENPLPPFDDKLPKQNVLKISSIGVDSEIFQNEDAYKGLLKGIWIVPDFGTPEKNDLPIIIAAHRFGYIEWTREFRYKSSFYNLPKLKVGDKVQIIWNQRSYEYEVYKSEDNSQITDYEADLILYTCRMYNSPTRVFRYLSRTN
jgi:sortase (surface protein transpeptidase)